MVNELCFLVKYSLYKCSHCSLLNHTIVSKITFTIQKLRLKSKIKVPTVIVISQIKFTDYTSDSV